ncbi:DUF3035 domain-containing protein [Ruixingdingia sedimenti]|uniref:DUF3035 domain-containing protein n=1 Tax=Ruixingdingia sedimenti TaxID=3073604 RepID=A0ABU1F6X9_9RHOB|nr:DUF3035 domain-containing protein [Xinfangfangia sp. LG-4]MDR5652589.1 DUF3035 domain-containing protein [Xinfangfangia sp. LG-4]
MQAGKGMIGGAALILILALSACGGGRGDAPVLRNLRSATGGPDEFAILPPKPLQMPPDFTALPEPTPGGGNLTDRDPMADAMVALGGKPGAGGNDGALVAAASAHGVSPTIREDLAREDYAIRDRNRPKLLERLLGTDVYNKAYSDQTVEQQRELERWRAAGRRTPASPPDPKQWPELSR